MQILGIESSCDETGVALVETTGAAMPRLLSHALYSQIEMHQAYGGVVPELASRDHIRRVLPLTDAVLAQAGLPTLDALDAHDKRVVLRAGGADYPPFEAFVQAARQRVVDAPFLTTGFGVTRHIVAAPTLPFPAWLGFTRTLHRAAHASKLRAER